MKNKCNLQSWKKCVVFPHEHSQNTREKGVFEQFSLKEVAWFKGINPFIQQINVKISFFR
jgi:hypothetical protein